MTIESSADIIGANAAVSLGAAPLRARSVLLTALGGNARLGDANVGATRGAALVQNVPVRIDASAADPVDAMSLPNLYVYVPSGTTVTYCWLV